MKKLLLIGALLVTGGLALQDVSTGHGGTYRGPGDTVPPGGGGGGGAGGATTPGPTGPTAPGTTPVTGGAATGAAPTGGPTGAGGVVTGAGDTAGADLTVWQFWWGFNKDHYLNLRAAIHSGAVATGSDEFFLGRNEKILAKDTLRPSEEQIRNTIVPALLKALETERQNDIVTGCLIALAKIGDAKDEKGESRFEAVIRNYLGDSVQEIAETSAIALGILANPASIPTLTDIALDTPKGRSLVGSTEVNYRTRAFATYGLGLIGYNVEDNALRKQVAEVLIGICQLPQMSTRDVHVAALIALGLVPVDSDPSAIIADGTAPNTPAYFAACRENQVRFVLDYFKNAKDNHFFLRAHCPRTLAKLLPDGNASLREEVAMALLAAADDRNKEKNEVVQSSVLALGQIGDCDADAIDEKIRKGLASAIGSTGDQQSKFFAVMSLAQVGGRPGQGASADSGYTFVKKELTTRLARSGAASGGSRMKPWLGLALGVMQNARTSETKGALDGEVAQVLRTALIECKTPAEVGAYCLGAGISRDLDATLHIVDKLSMADDEARGYAAIALGLMGARDQEATIQKIVKESKYRPDLLKQAAIALGLLGDKALVDDLIAMLREAKGLATQASLSSALGFIGDSRSVDPLVEMLGKQEITASARGFAAVALGIVADKEPLPWNAKISRDLNYRANTMTLTGQNGTGLLDIL